MLPLLSAFYWYVRTAQGYPRGASSARVSIPRSFWADGGNFCMAVGSSISPPSPHSYKSAIFGGCVDAVLRCAYLFLHDLRRVKHVFNLRVAFLATCLSSSSSRAQNGCAPILLLLENATVAINVSGRIFALEIRKITKFARIHFSHRRARNYTRKGIIRLRPNRRLLGIWRNFDQYNRSRFALVMTGQSIVVESNPFFAKKTTCSGIAHRPSS